MAAAARFQRAFCCGWPERVLRRNSKLASAKRLERYGPAPSTTANACHACRVATGDWAKMAASFGKAVFSPTTTRPTEPRSAAERKALQGKPGAACASSAGVMGL